MKLLLGAVIGILLYREWQKHYNQTWEVKSLRPGNPNQILSWTK